tara:strand:+ start:506 stop:1114 length:609 start_codon:yes stop_codon:yes gene_type:complete
MINVLLGSSNDHKIAEIISMSQGSNIAFICPAELNIALDVKEGVSSFAENASIKAMAYSRKYSGLVLADDSGFEVCELGGRPGVLSNRFEGLKTDYGRCQKVLSLLAHSDSTNRKAKFRCAMAIAMREELLFNCEAVCEGTVNFEPSGVNGFGYDPIFVPDGFSKSFAELSFADKNQISHRVKALNLVIDWINIHGIEAIGG